MSASALADPIFVSSRHILDTPNREELSFDHVLEDADASRLFAGVFKYYAEVFDSVHRFCKPRTHAGEATIYLLDADVVRNRLYRGKRQTATSAAIEYIFDNSTISYAFPHGAWEELLKHFARYDRAARRLDDLPVHLPALEFAARVAEVFGITDASQMSASDLEAAAEEELEPRLRAVSRFINILTNNRCKGVIHDFDPRHRKAWNELRPKKDNVKRDHNDERDALNLAVSTYPVSFLRNFPIHPPLPFYVLVTQTEDVYDLVRKIEVGGQYYDVVKRLFGIDANAVRANFPAAQPFEVYVAEKIGAFRLEPKYALEQATLLRNNCQYLGDYFTRIDLSRENSSESNKSSRYIRDRVNHDEARDVFKRLTYELFSSQSPFRQIESVRSTTNSLRLAADLQSKSDLSTLDRVRDRTKLFAKLLNALADAVGSVSGTELEYRLAVETEGTPVLRYEIRHCRNHHSGEPIAIVEIYEGLEKAPLYYSVSWPIVCDDADFVRALRSVLRGDVAALAMTEQSLGPRRLEQVDMDSPYWTKGLIVGTEDGHFGMSLVAAGYRRWRTLRLQRLTDKLRSAIARLNGSDDTSQADSDNVPMIEYIRLNLDLGDILYDVDLPPGSHSRRCTFISTVNLSAQIAEFARHTSQISFSSRPLFHVLEQILGIFPPYAG